MCGINNYPKLLCANSSGFMMFLYSLICNSLT
uniref:Uncharacterized protein n=1 Tax=Arundo donax TaxID=35708 RepID=A0A0A9BDH2_ARUDO